MQRVCGTSKDPKIYEENLRIVKRDGCEPEDIIDALLNGKTLDVTMNGGKPSKVYYNDVCKVSINPETGKLIQCNPISQKWKKSKSD